MRRRRGVFAWGEDKCRELGKQAGREEHTLPGLVGDYLEEFYSQLQRSAEARTNGEFR